MFDTMTMTKVVGAFCGALLIFLLSNWAAEAIYHEEVAHGEGEEVHQAYVIDTGEEGGEGEAEAEAVPFEEVFAAADAGAGERIWRQCSACHKLDGTNGTGPHLDGVVERDVAGLPDYTYSEALAALEGNWTPEQLSNFLTDPGGYAPGTKMTYRGLPDVEDRANIIAFLATASAS